MFDELLDGVIDTAFDGVETAMKGVNKIKQVRKEKREEETRRISRRLQDAREGMACTLATRYMVAWCNEIRSLISVTRMYPDNVEIMCKNTEKKLLKAYDSFDEEYPDALYPVRDEVYTYMGNLVGTMDITLGQALEQMIDEYTIYPFKEYLEELHDLFRGLSEKSMRGRR